MIGKVFGSLVVIGYHAPTMIAKVRCECGNTEYRRRFMLEQGRARMCKECQERKGYYETLKLDAQQCLTTLDPAVAARLMKAFAQHLATCKKYKAPPTRLATFIAEALADADFGE